MISIILLVLAGICNACMDVVQFHFSLSLFSRLKNQEWINPKISYKNKWNYESGFIKGEKFFGSSTIFVFVTDLWHFAKALMLLLIMLAIVFYQPMFKWYFDIIILYASFTITFELFYSKILVKNI